MPTLMAPRSSPCTGVDPKPKKKGTKCKLHVCPGHDGTVVGSRVRGLERRTAGCVLFVTCYLLQETEQLIPARNSSHVQCHVRPSSWGVR